MQKDDDTHLILEFLQHRLVKSISFEHNCESMTAQDFKKNIEIFRLILQYPVFAAGNPKRLKTGLLYKDYLSPKKLEMLGQYIMEVE